MIAAMATTVFSKRMHSFLRAMLLLPAKDTILPVSVFIILPSALGQNRMVFVGICMHRLDVLCKVRITDTPSAIARNRGNRRITAGSATDLVKGIAHIASVRHAEAASAIHAEMLCVVGVLHAHTVHTFGFFTAAILTKSAGITDLCASVTVCLTFLTDFSAIGALSASKAKLVASSAMGTVFTPQTRSTASANTAFVTEFVAVAKRTAFVAKGTDLNTLFAAFTAALANHRAHTAKRAGLAKAGIDVYGTVLAHTAINAMGITVARRAVAAALGANL